MNRILLIAKNDLHLFLKDKSGYFWLFGAPLLFAFFMGMIRGPGDPSDPRPELLLENKDAGFMGKFVVEELGLQGFHVVKSTEADRSQRGVRIPTNFTANILAEKPVKVEFFNAKIGADASALTEARLVRALISINSDLIELSGETNAVTENALRRMAARENPVKLDATFGSRKPVPAGYNQSIPGILVMFVLMNLLIFGGTTVASERREGVMRRFMVYPVSKTQLVFGKIIGLLGLGLAQIACMLFVSIFLMKFRIGSQFVPVLFVLLIYAWAAGSLGVLVGSIVNRDDKIIGICVLSSIVMAALGGCWWPLEIVPDKIRMFAHLTPPAWAMDALHQLISFGGSWPQITIPLIVLASFAGVANALAIRFFRA